jgi:SH3-like domain-containing protein
MKFWRTMKFKFFRYAILSVFFTFFIILCTFSTTKSVVAQQPTGYIPTVTGTPTGPLASVISYKAENNAINIRSGPSTNYDVIGLMYVDADYPVLGKSPGGDWLLIKDTSLNGGQGWVFSFNVNVTLGEIPVAEVPPTPMPKVTAAIDPTLAAQFVSTPLATKLPTFTPSAPLVIPTFEIFDSQSFAGIPIGLIILALFGLGLIIALFSYFQAR